MNCFIIVLTQWIQWGTDWIWWLIIGMPGPAGSCPRGWCQFLSSQYCQRSWYIWNDTHTHTHTHTRTHTHTHHSHTHALTHTHTHTTHTHTHTHPILGLVHTGATTVHDASKTTDVIHALRAAVGGVLPMAVFEASGSAKVCWNVFAYCWNVFAYGLLIFSQGNEGNFLSWKLYLLQFTSRHGLVKNRQLLQIIVLYLLYIYYFIYFS